MMLRPARLVLICLMLILFWPDAGASTPEAAGVDDKIDRITEPPEYDWLRQNGAGGGDDVGSNGEIGASADRNARTTANASDCGFSPSASPATKREVPPPDSPSCGKRPSGCSRSPAGSCNCGSPIGACSAPGIGAMSSIGYLLVGLFLAFLVGLVVAAIVKRRHRGPAEETADAGDIQSPSDVRPSQVPVYSVSAIMARAHAAAGEGNFKNAVGFAYLAGIDHLHRLGLVDLRRSTTNMEIVAAVARSNGLKAPTARLVRVFEDLFFGGHVAGREHWETCRSIVEETFGHGAKQN